VELGVQAHLDDFTVSAARNRLVHDAKASLTDVQGGDDLDKYYVATQNPYLPESDKTSATSMLKMKLSTQLEAFITLPQGSKLRQCVAHLNMAVDGRVPEFPEATLAKARAAFRKELAKEIKLQSQGATVSTLPQFDEVMEAADSSAHHWAHEEEEEARKETEELHAAINAAREVHGREHQKSHWIRHLEASRDDRNTEQMRTGIKEAKAAGCSTMQLQPFEEHLAKREAAISAAKMKVNTAMTARSIDGLDEAVTEGERAGLDFEEDGTLMHNARVAIHEEQEKNQAMSELKHLARSMKDTIDRCRRAGVSQTDIAKVLPTAA
jgi:hypothetical protein